MLTSASTANTNHQLSGSLGTSLVYDNNHTAVAMSNIPIGFEIAQPRSAKIGNARATTGNAASPISSTVSSVAIACSI